MPRHARLVTLPNQATITILNQTTEEKKTVT